MVPKALSRNPCNLSWKWESKRCGQVASFTTFHNLHLNFQTSCAQRATKTRKKLKRSKWATSTLCKMCCGDPAPLKQSKPLSTLGVALGCRASAIIYRKTRVYGDYQWIIAINASTRPLTLQPNATPRSQAKAEFSWIVTVTVPWACMANIGETEIFLPDARHTEGETPSRNFQCTNISHWIEAPMVLLSLFFI